jgi:SAM-dependent methyltransferase
MRRRAFIAGAAAAGLAGWAHANDLMQIAQQRGPDVVFVPTPNDVVDKMLELAAVTADDRVYDLGCGDGRIVITAAQRYHARGVGIDIDPRRIAEAAANARNAGVADRVRFLEADLFEADIHDATVVTLYLLTRLNAKLKPRLLQELKPGTRVVSHAFDMGDWEPERKEFVGASAVYLWRIPGRA